MGPASGLLEVLRRSQAAGLLGPGPIERHVEHAGAFIDATPPPHRFLDLGSGGGVPGLVLAIDWPEALGTLVDAQARRVRFLSVAIDELDLGDRVAALHARAEDLANTPEHRGRYDVVTARSFGPPGRTAECGAGFLREGGLLVVAEPPGAPAERWPTTGLESVGLVDRGCVTRSGSTVRVLESLTGPRDGVPRRAAAVLKRPRF